MTQDEIKAIEEIKGTGGFRVMESLMRTKLDKLDSVSTVDENIGGNLEAIFLAKQYAVRILNEFLSEINLISKPKGETKRTYE